MEVLDMFYDMVRGWFKKSAGNYNAFVKALLINDVEAMNEYMNVISEEIFSNFDVGTKPSKLQPERLVSCYDCKGVANGSRACEKTRVFSCVLLLMVMIIVILHKKGYNSPYPIRMLL